VIQVLPEPLSWWTDCFCVRSKALAYPARIQASEILTETGRRAATGCLRHLPTARHDSSCKTRAEREFKTSSIPARSLHLVSRRVGAISGMSSPQNVEGRAGVVCTGDDFDDRRPMALRFAHVARPDDASQCGPWDGTAVRGGDSS
jgi:hypothetical protein